MTVISFISYATITLIISITAFLMVPLVPGADRWYQLVIVQSASMEPYLKVGGLALYKKVVEYAADDVIAYQHGDGDDVKMVLHRVVQKRVLPSGDVHFVTKGDALDQNTVSVVRPSQIKGRVLGSIPKLGYVISWMQTSNGLLVSMSIPILVLLLHMIWR